MLAKFRPLFSACLPPSVLLETMTVVRKNKAMSTHIFRSTSAEPKRPTHRQSQFIHQRPHGRSSAPWILALLALALGGMRLPAQINVTIPGTANIFGAGHASPPQPGAGGAGTLPIQVVVPNGATYVTFTGVAGAVSWCPRPLTSPPEGVTGYGGTSISSYGGISGIVVNNRAIFLTGVFSDNAEPADPAPAILTFTASGIGFSTLAPALKPPQRYLKHLHATLGGAMPGWCPIIASCREVAAGRARAGGRGRRRPQAAIVLGSAQAWSNPWEEIGCNLGAHQAGERVF